MSMRVRLDGRLWVGWCVSARTRRPWSSGTTVCTCVSDYCGQTALSPTYLI